MVDLLDAILIFSNCSMMTGCHQLDFLLARSYLQESLKKKTLYAISRSNWFSAGLEGINYISNVEVRNGNVNTKRLTAAHTRVARAKQASCLRHWLSVLTLAVPLFRFILQQDR